MTDREKLIELMNENFTEYCNVDIVAGHCKIRAITFDVDRFADFLISNGVTVQKWIPVSERLPEEKTYVLISCGGNVHVARIKMGIDEQMRDAMKRGVLSDPLIPSWSASTGYTWVKRSMLYSGCDVHGNNLVPYCWYSNYGPGKWFGQEVSHWMLLPEPPKEDV